MEKCPRKKYGILVSIFNLSWPKLSQLLIQITDQIQIPDPDYESGNIYHPPPLCNTSVGIRKKKQKDCTVQISKREDTKNYKKTKQLE